MMDIKESLNEHLLPWCEAELGGIRDQQIEQLVAYLTLLLQYKQKVNIIGSSDLAVIVKDLVLDSLQILTLKPMPGPLVDVGSGAGFPGVPIKIMCPDLAVYLVEPNVKRYAFLRMVERKLGLQGMGIHNCRVEEFPDIRVGTAISKAFRALPAWLKCCEPWLARGAKAACLCSENDWDLLGKPWLEAHPYCALLAQKRVAQRFYGIVAMR